jgi:hypothetical protein
MTEQPAGTTPEQPLFFKWVRDEQGQVNWGRVVLALALTVATAYLSVQTQRSASSPDFARSARMGLAQKKITAGVKIQRIGKAVENAGWAAYEAAR